MFLEQRPTDILIEAIGEVVVDVGEAILKHIGLGGVLEAK
jgi:hypothetical protein